MLLGLEGVDLSERGRWFSMTALWITVDEGCGRDQLPPPNAVTVSVPALDLCVWFRFISIAVAKAIAGLWAQWEHGVLGGAGHLPHPCEPTGCRSCLDRSVPCRNP